MTLRPLVRRQIVARRVIGSQLRVRLSCSHDVNLPRRIGEREKPVWCPWCEIELEQRR